MTGIDAEIRQLVDALRKFKPGGALERFITHIRFPRFKNLRPGARLSFDFPITALVGSNGCGKTSVLHALYGAPERKSTSDFWFSTSVDPIDERNDDPHRFIYGHWLKDKQFLPTGGVVETRKARVKKEGDPEYWEPTKVTSGDEMKPMPGVPPHAQFGGPKERVRSQDRWSAVKRDVLYLNFRGELGAFDQFFWFGQLKPNAVHSKQEILRRRAPFLRRVIDSGDKSLVRYGKEHIFKNVAVSRADLETASDILGKSYGQARRIEHDLYGLRGFSAVFSVDDLAYSEAFAGSGEIAVLNLVARIREQADHSLILLDEPEVSLHPGAQKQLLKFLMEECKKKKHQIVFTTHSPHLVEALPSNAIKVFTADNSGRFDVINETHPYAAFHRLGATPPGRVKVLVEDRLTKHVVDLALKQLAEHDRPTFDVDFLPGGASTYLTHRIPTIMTEASTWLLLDGDQRRAESKPSKSVPPDQLENTIAQLTGVDARSIVLGADGGNDPDAKAKKHTLYAAYLDFFHSRVRFLPRSCPEEIVLRAVKADAAPATSEDAKKLLRAILKKTLGVEPSSSDSDAQAQLLLAQSSRDKQNDDLVTIAELLRSMLPLTGSQ